MLVVGSEATDAQWTFVDMFCAVVIRPNFATWETLSIVRIDAVDINFRPIADTDCKYTVDSQM